MVMTMLDKRRSCLIFFGFLAVAVQGHPPQQVHLKDLGCARPIFKRSVRECCQVTMDKVWGDLSASFNTCGKKEQNRVGELVSRTTEESESRSDEIPNGKESMQYTEMNNGSTKFQQLISTEKEGNPPLKKLGEIIKAAYNLYKNWINILQDSIVLLADGNRIRGRKECYMECVFKEEKLLKDNKVDKNAVLERFKSNQRDTEEWHKVMLNAAETCLQKEFGPSSNSLCTSGASDVFECVFKEVFFHCPTWPVNNQYCESLRDFYLKCPDNPPPPMDDMNVTMAVEPEKEVPTTTAVYS